MKKERFFGFLGRANAVILFLVGLGILGFMGYGLWDTWEKNRSPNHHDSKWAYRQPDAGGPLEDPLLPRGRFKETGDPAWVFAEYEVEREEVGPRKGVIREVVVNYLFLNTDTGETRWLRPDHSGVVQFLDYENIFVFDYDDIRVPFLVYRAREEDTDGNGVIDRNDREGLAISGRDGSGFHVLLEELGFIHFMKTNAAGNSTILHRLGDEFWLVEIDPEARNLVRHEKVEIAPVEKPRSRG
jgi:hypothetical protein